MKMKHSIYDTDAHFSIDPVTRAMKNEGSTKNTLIQGDHNSERFTFELPREIEGHDLSKCDSVQVHYNNIDALTKAESRGVYVVDDLQVSPDGSDVVICSWLISGNATKYVGALGFLLRFTCYGEDGSVSYVWNTAIYNKITVSDGLYNGEAVAEEYADILKGWKDDLEANQVLSLKQTRVATEDNGLNTWTATMGDGRTYSFDVRNGSRGPTGFVGSIETVDGKPLRFFVGTQAEYNALPESTKKSNLFAIISDDPTGDNIKASLASLTSMMDTMKSEMSLHTTAISQLGGDVADLENYVTNVRNGERAVPLAGAVSSDTSRLTIPNGSESVTVASKTFEMGCSYALSVYETNVAAAKNHRGTSYFLEIPNGLTTGTDVINVAQSTLSVTLRKKADGSGEYEELSYIKVQLLSDGRWVVSIERRTFSGTTVTLTNGATIVARKINNV